MALEEPAHLRQAKPHLLATHTSLAVSWYCLMCSASLRADAFQWVYWECEGALNTGQASAPEGGASFKTKPPEAKMMRTAVV